MRPLLLLMVAGTGAVVDAVVHGSVAMWLLLVVALIIPYLCNGGYRFTWLLSCIICTVVVAGVAVDGSSSLWLHSSWLS